MPPGLGVGHGFVGSSVVQGVGDGVGVARVAACTVFGRSSHPDVMAIPADKYTTDAAIIIATVLSESAFVFIFESMEPPLSESLPQVWSLMFLVMQTRCQQDMSHKYVKI